MNLSTLTEFITGSPRRVHLIGVAGSGMSGIAALVLALGHRVSGSDKAETVEVERLKKKGLQFFRPHQAGEVKDAELVVYSSAIKPGNIAYDLHESVTDHSKMVFVEQWENAEALGPHRAAEHSKAFGRVVVKCLAAPPRIEVITPQKVDVR